MLSALKAGALRSGLGALRVISVTPARTETSLVGTKPIKQYTKEERVEQWDYVNSVFYGPERDLKNFPLLVQPDGPPPVRMGIFPASWFEFFYPKTGVTGPYVFGAGLWIWMLSKEVMVIEHTFWEIPSFWGAVWFINYKWGSAIRKMIDDHLKRKEDVIYNKPIQSMRSVEEESIAINQRLIEETETSKHLYQAKKEGVQLQLEAAFRQRLLTAYQEVKKRLDYEVEKENAKRRFEQEHMVNWIVSNVTKSITPQQEKESIQSCLRTLKGLAAKQAVA